MHTLAAMSFCCSHCSQTLLRLCSSYACDSHFNAHVRFVFSDLPAVPLIHVRQRSGRKDAVMSSKTYVHS